MFIAICSNRNLAYFRITYELENSGTYDLIVKCAESNICLSNFKIFRLWVCSEIYDKALPSRHYPLTWPVMNVVFNVAGYEYPL